MVRTFRVCPSEPVTIPANKSTVVSVHVEMDKAANPVSLLLEGNGAVCKNTGLIIDRALLQPSDDGKALKIHNVGGFTERIEEGALLGDAEETCVVIPPEDDCAVPGEVKQIRMGSIQEN